MWPTYLINLADNTARLKNCAAQFSASRIKFQSIDAVNGWKLSDQEVSHVYDSEKNQSYGKHPLVLPEIGCYLSHIHAWQKIANGDHDGGFIFEDDFVANEQLGSVLELLQTDSGDWGMVKLFSLNPDQRIISRRSLGNNHEIVIPYRVPTCLLGYGLRRDAARKLVDRSDTFFRPVDEDMKYFWETGLKVALVTPTPLEIGDQQTSTGTIGDARRTAPKKQSFRSRITQASHGISYQLRYSFLLHWHRKWKKK